MSIVDQHDGDEVTRYAIAVTDGQFSASILAWGNTDKHIELASALTSFPNSATSIVSYQFGSSGTGLCKLHFFCLDDSGHIGVWASVEGPYPIGQTKGLSRQHYFSAPKQEQWTCSQVHFINSLRIRKIWLASFAGKPNYSSKRTR
jgi:hypothetical protein